MEAMKQAHNGGRKFDGGGANLRNNLEGLDTKKSRALRIDFQLALIERRGQNWAISITLWKIVFTGYPWPA